MGAAESLLLVVRVRTARWSYWISLSGSLPFRRSSLQFVASACARWHRAHGTGNVCPGVSSDGGAPASDVRPVTIRAERQYGLGQHRTLGLSVRWIGQDSAKPVRRRGPVIDFPEKAVGVIRYGNLVARGPDIGTAVVPESAADMEKIGLWISVAACISRTPLRV
jgi:hypothetical protein